MEKIKKNLIRQHSKNSVEDHTKVKNYFHQVDQKDNKNCQTGLHFQLLKIELWQKIILPKYRFRKMNVKLKNNNLLKKLKRNLNKVWIIRINKNRLVKVVIISIRDAEVNLKKTTHHLDEWATQGKNRLNFNKENHHRNNILMQKWVQIWFVTLRWF